MSKPTLDWRKCKTSFIQISIFQQKSQLDKILQHTIINLTVITKSQPKPTQYFCFHLTVFPETVSVDNFFKLLFMVRLYCILF